MGHSSWRLLLHVSYTEGGYYNTTSNAVRQDIYDQYQHYYAS
jgi:hypothetical protein